MDDSYLENLERLVGNAGLLRHSQDLSGYEIGAREGAGRAAFVVRPSSVEQVSAVVGYCVRHGIELIAQGANTGLVGASTPDASGAQAVLSFERLSDCLDINVGNRSVTVMAGMRLSTLNQLLAEKGLVLPIDLGADPSIGGMVSTNTGGARFLRYGDVRDHVLGLEVVLPNRDGTVLDLMASLRKNNVGFDASQLFVGTAGANGFITKIVLEVHRLPKQTAAAILVPRDDDAVIELLEAFEGLAGNDLTAFEGMSGNAMMAALTHSPKLRSPFGSEKVPPFAILVEIARIAQRRHGEPSLEEMLTDILGEIWAMPTQPLANAFIGSPQDFWEIRHTLTDGLRASGRVIAFDISFARTDVMAFRREMIQELSITWPQLRVCDFGHVGDGGVHFNLVEIAQPDSRLDSEQVYLLKTQVFDKAVHVYGGSFSAEHGIGRANRDFYRKYVGLAEQEIAARIGELVRTVASARQENECVETVATVIGADKGRGTSQWQQ